MKVCRLCRHYAPGVKELCPRDGGELVEGPVPIVAPGESIGPYKVGRAMAAGQSGVLLEVRDEDDDADAEGLIAKILNPMAGPVDARRPVLETVVGLDLDGVHPLLELREEKDRICLIQSVVPGNSFAVRCKKDGPLDAAQTVELGKRLCQTVANIHEAGLQHHDIRPGHLLIPDGSPLSKAELLDLGSPSPPGPMSAPELHQGLGGTAPTDVYGVCVTLYVALAGRSPFRADSPEELSWMVRSAPPPPLKVVREGEGVEPALEQLIMWGLSKDPRDRPSVEKVATVLGALEEGAAEKIEEELEGAPKTALPPRPEPPPAAQPVDEAPPELSAVAAALRERNRSSDDENPTMRIVRKIVPKSILKSTGLTQSFFIEGDEMEREVARFEAEEALARRENILVWMRLITILLIAGLLVGLTVWGLTR